MLMDIVVICAIIIGVVNGLSKLKGRSYTSSSSTNLLEFLLINK